MEGYENPICKSPISVKNTPLDKNIKRTIFISRTLTFENVGERSFPKSTTYTRLTFE